MAKFCAFQNLGPKFNLKTKLYIHTLVTIERHCTPLAIHTHIASEQCIIHIYATVDNNIPAIRVPRLPVRIHTCARVSQPPPPFWIYYTHSSSHEIYNIYNTLHIRCNWESLLIVAGIREPINTRERERETKCHAYVCIYNIAILGWLEGEEEISRAIVTGAFSLYSLSTRKCRCRIIRESVQRAAPPRYSASARVYLTSRGRERVRYIHIYTAETLYLIFS